MAPLFLKLPPLLPPAIRITRRGIWHKSQYDSQQQTGAATADIKP
jgi:hypothetical protein